MTIDIEKLADEFLHGTDRNGAYYGYVDDLKHFAEAYAAKVLEDKEREIAELEIQNVLYKDDELEQQIAISELQAKNSELSASINDLREALERLIKHETPNWSDEFAWKIYRATPAQSLQSFESEVIERCAKVCDEASQPHQDEIHTVAQWAAKVLAANIRALKVNV